jgi:DNA integrity scanning protein DisA with diadenylate cyclase activity
VFASVREDTEHYLAVSPERNVICWEPSHQRSNDRRLRDEAQKQAVLKAIEERDLYAKGECYFSGFMPVANYDVGVVLILKHKHHCSHYQLPQVYADERFKVPASLIEAAAEIFLRFCRKSLHVPHPENVAEWDGPETDAILRKAGARVMEAPIFTSGGINGLYSLFDACNYISSLTYESATSAGEMFIARTGHANLQPTLVLDKPVDLSHYRAIRKLLEISRAGDAIMTDGDAVTGFGKLVGSYDQTQADLHTIRFTGHHKWELLHAEHKLMRVTFGRPALPLPPLNEYSFTEDAERIFKPTKPEKIKKLFALAEAACQQRHGTVLVITPEAATEAKRLATQSTGIVPVAATPELLRSITAIDGAVLLDTDGVCYAIGVILDGEALELGNPARGARYNSSLRYNANLNKLGKQCLVVVVSEDGAAEWIPELLPRQSRRELKEKETELDTLLKMEELPISRSSQLLSWLSDHRVYLSKETCDKANRVEEIRIKILTQKRALFINHNKFEPHPELSDDYFKD